MNYLLDKYKERGKALNSYRNCAELIDANTKVLDVESNELRVLQYLKTNYKEMSAFNTITLLEVDNSDWYTIDDIQKSMKTHKINESAFRGSEDVVRELVSKRTMLYLRNYDNPRILFLSDKICKTYPELAYTSLDGELLEYNDIKKAIALSLDLCMNDFQTKIVVRVNSHCEKVFAMFEPRYERTPFINLYDIAKNIPDIQKVNWEITNKGALLHIELAEVKGIIPGILLTTSDTGYYQNKLIPTIRMAGAKEYFTFKGDGFNEINENTIKKIVENSIKRSISYAEAVKEWIEGIDDTIYANFEDFEKDMKIALKQFNILRNLGKKKYERMIKELSNDARTMSKKEIYSRALDAINDNALSECQLRDYRQSLIAILK